jgi:hypothetical protein
MYLFKCPLQLFALLSFPTSSSGLNCANPSHLLRIITVLEPISQLPFTLRNFRDWGTQLSKLYLIVTFLHFFQQQHHHQHKRKHYRHLHRGSPCSYPKDYFKSRILKLLNGFSRFCPSRQRQPNPSTSLWRRRTTRYVRLTYSSSYARH